MQGQAGWAVEFDCCKVGFICLSLFSGEIKVADKSDASVECTVICMLGSIRHACCEVQRPS